MVLSRVVVATAVLLACVMSEVINIPVQYKAPTTYTPLESRYKPRRVSTLSNVPIQGWPQTDYFVRVSFGTPAQTFECILDTGSSNLAIAAAPFSALNNKYFDTSLSTSYVNIGKSISTRYGTGSWTGTQAKDVVSLGSANSSATVTFAAITSQNEFFQAGTFNQGILGMAFVAIANPLNNPITPFFDSLVNAGKVANVFSLQLCPMDIATATVPTQDNGLLTLGGLNATRYIGDLVTIPLSHETYYQVTMAVRIGIGSAVYTTPTTQEIEVIIDSGTNELLLPTILFNEFESQINQQFGSLGIDIAELMDGKVCLTDLSVVQRFPALTFYLLDQNNKFQGFTIQPETYLRPSGQDSQGQWLYCNVAVPTSTNGPVILGVPFLEGFYAVFNKGEKYLQFAPTFGCSKNIPGTIVDSGTTGSPSTAGPTLSPSPTTIPSSGTGVARTVVGMLWGALSALVLLLC